VAQFGKIHIAGFLAWFVWVFVHLMYLVEFENRLLVFVEWVYNHLTRNRGARRANPIYEVARVSQEETAAS
jgi:NADH dehydrogenase